MSDRLKQELEAALKLIREQAGTIQELRQEVKILQEIRIRTAERAPIRPELSDSGARNIPGSDMY